MMIPKKLDKITLILISVASVIVMVIAHDLPRKSAWYPYKKRAAETMFTAEKVLVEKMTKESVAGETGEQPGRKGLYGLDDVRENVEKILVGRKRAPLKTTKGLREAKIAVTDPNFAAVVVELFKDAGVREGDTIAVAFTGSLPGANIAVLSAAEAMKLKPIIISSLGASRWGATSPRLTWLDIEKILYDEGVFPFRSIAASLGGLEDVQASKRELDRQLLKDIVKKDGVPLIYEENIDRNIQKRMALYDEHAEERPIKAFVNVGGGVAVLGEYSYREQIPPGVIFDLPLDKFSKRGVIIRMIERGTPVINIRNIKQFVKQYHLQPMDRQALVVGEGAVFFESKYNVLIGAAALFSLLLIITGAIGFDFYILSRVYKGRFYYHEKRYKKPYA